MFTTDYFSFAKGITGSSSHICYNKKLIFKILLKCEVIDSYPVKTIKSIIFIPVLCM